MLVELGGGMNPHPEATLVIDTRHPRGCEGQDATVTPWLTSDGTPIPDGSADRVYCSHFLEHIPAGQPKINIFNEAWRILKSGGTFDMILPLVGYTDPDNGQPMSNQIGWQPWADPTHVGFWWFPESLLYFCEGNFRPHADYGINVWSILGPYGPDPFSRPQGGWFVIGGWEAHARMVKP
jgi:SAM-dependent methyltransferase